MTDFDTVIIEAAVDGDVDGVLRAARSKMDEKRSQFEKLRAANQTRQAAWPGGQAASDPLFRAVEFGGEAGELLDSVKKYARAVKGIAGNSDNDIAGKHVAVMEEMGDVLISLDLLAAELGIDLAECVPMKFNKTSRKVGVPVFMESDTWDPFEQEDLLRDGVSAP